MERLIQDSSNRVFTRSLIQTLVVLLLSLGCVSKQRVEQDETKGWNEQPGQSFRVSLEWYKKKKTKFDVTVVLTNKYPHKVVIPSGGIQVFVGGLQGTSSGNDDELVLNPGEQTSRLVLVKFGSELASAKEAEIRVNNLAVAEEVEGEISTTDESGKLRKFFKKKTQTVNKTFKGTVAQAGKALPPASLKFSLEK